MSKNANLTAREGQVARLLAQGKNNHEIARELGINVKTVDTHRGHVLEKLGVRNNAELVLHAVAAGWVAGRLAPMASPTDQTGVAQ